SDAIAAKLRKRIADEIPDALVTVLGPPPVSGLGSSGGFKLIVEDRSGDNDVVKLQRQTERPINEGKKDPRVAGLFTVFRANSPQLFVDLNRKQCQTLGVDVREVFSTQQVYLGSLYVNDFNKFGRTWQVVVQAEGVYRNDMEKVKGLKVRN